MPKAVPYLFRESDEKKEQVVVGTSNRRSNQDQHQDRDHKTAKEKQTKLKK